MKAPVAWINYSGGTYSVEIPSDPPQRGSDVTSNCDGGRDTAVQTPRDIDQNNSDPRVDI